MRILKAIDPSITCFFDQNIAEGNQWAEQINAELKRANRLILIYTGNHKNYETCVYEVATFQALHLDGSAPSQTDTVTCLHDTEEVPTTFMAYQNCRIMTPDSKEGQDFSRRMNVTGTSARDFYLASPCGQFLKRLVEQYHGAIAPGPTASWRTWSHRGPRRSQRPSSIPATRRYSTRSCTRGCGWNSVTTRSRTSGKTI